MLEITRQADYALRACVEVAHSTSVERIPTAEIAARQGIPLPFLAKIVSQLVIRGILDSTRGANGGVKLARPPEEISLLEVIEAIDGPVALNRCTREPSSCEMMSTCPLCEIFGEAEESLTRRFRTTTLSDIVIAAHSRRVLVAG